jgi:hypothetical protein
MRYAIIIILAMSAGTTCLGQALVTIKDTVNHFEIGVPGGWRCGVPANKSVTFVAMRQKQNEQDVPKENFNVNIIHTDETNFDDSYGYFLESIGEAEGFKILDHGERIIRNRKYKYLIETHKNKISKEDMTDFVLFTNNNGEILILTMVTISANFEKFKSLFDAIALSLNY